MDVPQDIMKHADACAGHHVMHGGKKYNKSEKKGDAHE